jgi:formylglycine-generating enzyme required for sulfatase activity
MIRALVLFGLAPALLLAGPLHQAPPGAALMAKTFTNSIGLELVRIDPGTFVMGSPANEPGRFPDEGPQRTVTITRPFYLGKYPVTRGQFRTFVEATRYKTECETDGQGGQGWDPDKKGESRGPQYHWQNAGFQQTDEHPVVNVTYADCQAFLKWLSKKEARTYELPREAEWEYACRAGTTTYYYFGNDAKPLVEYAWFLGNSEHKSTDVVGRRKPNAWGLYDMHGNVFQWCQDYYVQDYEGLATVDPRGAAKSECRALRGGAFDDQAERCRSAFRIGIEPSVRIYRYGFRVCLRPE